MRRAPAATPRMRPEVRPRKLTRRSASPSAKGSSMMASVSRAGMKCRRDRLERRVRKVPEQAGRTCRTRLNTTGEDASQCWRGEGVEEMEESLASGEGFEWIFKTGKPSSNTLNVGAPTFLGDRDEIAYMEKIVPPLRG